MIRNNEGEIRKGPTMAMDNQIKQDGLNKYHLNGIKKGNNIT